MSNSREQPDGGAEVGGVGNEGGEEMEEGDGG